MSSQQKQEQIDDEQDYIIKGKVLRDVSNYARGSWVGGVVSRPVSAAPVWTDAEVMKEIEDAFDRGIEAAENTIDMQKHDAAVAEQASRDTIKELQEYYSNLPEHEATCPFGKMNSEECEGMEGDCETCILNHAIESLRQGLEVREG